MSVANHEPQPSGRWPVEPAAVSEPPTDFQDRAPAWRVKGVVRLPFALWGVVRDTVYVTLDALRGGYDR
jgi:hypothetical protein